MNRLWLAVLALSCLLSPGFGHADDLVAIPPLQARVTDLTGTVSREEAAALEQSLVCLV